MIGANVEEDREATMARFLSGLNREIDGVVELQHYVELEVMVHMAIMERQQNEKSNCLQPNPSSSLWKLSWSKDERLLLKQKPHHQNGGKVASQVGGEFEIQARIYNIKCFRCLGTGHIPSQCPNKRAIVKRDDCEIETEGESDEDSMPPLEDVDEDGVEYPVEREALVVKHMLNAQIK